MGKLDVGSADHFDGVNDVIGILLKPGLKFIPVFDYEQVLVVASNHALAKVDHVKPRQLGQEVLISYPVPLLESQRKKSEDDGLELVEENDLNRRLSLQDMVQKANSNNNGVSCNGLSRFIEHINDSVFKV